METITFETETRYQETFGSRKITLSKLYYKRYLSGYLVRVENKLGNPIVHLHFDKKEAYSDYQSFINLAKETLI